MARFKEKVRLDTCSACGAQGPRTGARFCLTCGKLMSEGYQPLDTLRASYNLLGKELKFAPVIPAVEEGNLFEENKNNVAQTAWACVVYSMVPYLGILFIPFAFLIGGAGVVVAHRQPQLGGRKLAVSCIALSAFLLAVQIFLWYLLYIIPEIGL